MLRAMITPLTIYQLDNTVFDGLIVPTRPFNNRGYSDMFLTGWDMDKDTLINNILLETAELSVLYTDPAFFKFAVTNWAKKELPVWQALYETIFFKYNPIWNKDGTVKETAEDLINNTQDVTRSSTTTTDMTSTDTLNLTDTHDMTDTRTPNLSTVTETEGSNTGTVRTVGSDDNTETHSGTITTANTVDKTNTGTQTDRLLRDEDTTHSGPVTTSGTETSENKVAAFDSATYQNRDKTETTRSETVTDTSATATDVDQTDTRTDNLREQIDNDTTVTDATSIVNARDTEDIRTDNLLHAEETMVTETGTDTSTHDGTITHTGTDTERNAGTVTVSDRTLGGDDSEVQRELERKEYGNIGVTMTQQLIEAERALVKFNIYDVIIDSFKNRFCLLIY